MPKDHEHASKLGHFVRRQRERRGLSGQTLAAMAGVDKSYLHRLEHGEIGSPDPRVLVGLARALELDVADLYLEAGYASGRGLPRMEPYLRATLGLPDDAIQQIEEYVEFMNQRYGREGGHDDERHSPAA